MRVETPEEAVAFVESVGLCAWRGGTPLPSLEAATPWAETGDVMWHTWFWKDDLHIEGRLFYGQLWDAGVPVFVALRLLPLLIAAQGDIDPQDLFERGRISRLALTLYRHIERQGPAAKRDLPYPPRTSQTPPLVQLQQTFLLTKHGLTGRGRGTYGYLWGRCEARFPKAFDEAARWDVGAAREQIVEELRRHAPALERARIARGLRWPQERGA